MSPSSKEAIAVSSGKSHTSKTAIHPLFNDPNANLTIISREGTNFHVNSSLLLAASKWFQGTLSVQASNLDKRRAGPAGSLELDEGTDTLAAFLSVVYWRPLPALSSIELIEDLLRAGEHYEVPVVVSLVRLAIVSPPILDMHPIRAYGIANAREWHDEAKLAAEKTVALDLLSEDHSSDLDSIESRCVNRLMRLHRRRRDIFRQILEDGTLFPGNAGTTDCAHCAKRTTHFQWIRVKSIWWSMIESAPASIASKAFVYSKEACEVLEAECGNCRGKLYNTATTLRILSDVVDRLPTVA